MRQPAGMKRNRGPVALAELVGKALDPVTAKRGFAVTEVNACWAEIVGARYADCSRPERIIWPRGSANDGKAGVLVVRIEGPRALFLQHEADQVIQRVNAFLGRAAIDKIRIVQGPVAAQPRRGPPEAKPLAPEALSTIEEVLSGVDGDDLRSALDRLGRAVFADRASKS